MVDYASRSLKTSSSILTTSSQRDIPRFFLVAVYVDRPITIANFRAVQVTFILFSTSCSGGLQEAHPRNKSLQSAGFHKRKRNCEDLSELTTQSSQSCPCLRFMLISGLMFAQQRRGALHESGCIERTVRCPHK